MADYPSAVTSFPTIVDLVDPVLALHQNERADEIVAVQTTLGTNPQGSAADLKTRLARSMSDAGMLDFASSTVLTIASGSITPTQNFHRVETESGAASDDLDTIVATSLSDGFVLVIRPTNTAHTVVLTNSGNINTGTALNITLDDDTDFVILVYDANLTNWVVVALSPSSIPILASGSWTPTLTNTTNIDASVAHTCYYIRMGNNVTFWGVVEVDATTAAVACVLKVTLPIASDFTATEDADGNVSSPGTSAVMVIGSIVPDTTLNTLDFRFTPTVNTNVFYRFAGGYVIK